MKKVVPQRGGAWVSAARWQTPKTLGARELTIDDFVGGTHSRTARHRRPASLP
ncbi:MAG: hypothetical protein ABJA98_11555 [Acidobacteriota bacterium]